MTNNTQLSQSLLGIAADLRKNNQNDFSKRIEELVDTELLNAPYPAAEAYRNHNALFAERHEMAVFLHNHLAEIKQTAEQRRNMPRPISDGKIKVFTYWDNPDSMPPVVQICRRSMQQYVGNEMQLIVLDKTNYQKWIDFDFSNLLPNISQAHFSDLLRLKLLEKWGGFWLDATCLLTKDLYHATTQIREQEQFLFAYVVSRTGSWFIWSKPDSYVLNMVSAAIDLWWKKEKRLTNYFMLHDIVEMFYYVDSEYRRQWDAMLKKHPKEALALLRSYEKTDSLEGFAKILSGSFVHKLTYKYNNEVYPPPKATEYQNIDYFTKTMPNICRLLHLFYRHPQG